MIQKTISALLIAATLPASAATLFLVNENDGQACRAAPPGLSAEQVVAKIPGTRVMSSTTQALPGGATLYRVQTPLHNSAPGYFDFTDSYSSCTELVALRKEPLKPTPSELKRGSGEAVFLMNTQCQFDTHPLAKNASSSVHGLSSAAVFGCWYDEGAYVRLHLRLFTNKNARTSMNEVEVLAK